MRRIFPPFYDVTCPPRSNSILSFGREANAIRPYVKTKYKAPTFIGPIYYLQYEQNTYSTHILHSNICITTDYTYYCVLYAKINIAGVLLIQNIGPTIVVPYILS